MEHNKDFSDETSTPKHFGNAKFLKNKTSKTDVLRKT